MLSTAYNWPVTSGHEPANLRTEGSNNLGLSTYINRNHIVLQYQVSLAFVLDNCLWCQLNWLEKAKWIAFCQKELANLSRKG